MSSNADRLREAFESRQLDRLIDLMDPGVTWRGIQEPGEEVPICRDRVEVRDVMTAAIARGRDGSPVIIAEAGDSLVVDPRAKPPGSVELHQVVTFRGGRIVLMQDFPNRSSALMAIR
jgi:ketosteroid isomerase-like protein